MSLIHCLFTGATQTGKTTLARAIARQYSDAGHNVVVYDPVLGTDTAGGGWPDNAALYDDADEFIDALSDPDFPPCHVFIDEAGDIFDHTQRENRWLATRGRHYGYQLNIITQRPRLISPSVRGQCGTCYMFRLAREDAELVGRDFGHSGIGKISLDTGDFVVLTSGHSSIKRANVFQLLGD